MNSEHVSRYMDRPMRRHRTRTHIIEGVTARHLRRKAAALARKAAKITNRSDGADA
jgi:hypothetical protein